MLNLEGLKIAQDSAENCTQCIKSLSQSFPSSCKFHDIFLNFNLPSKQLIFFSSLCDASQLSLHNKKRREENLRRGPATIFGTFYYA